MILFFILGESVTEKVTQVGELVETLLRGQLFECGWGEETVSQCD